MAVRILIVDDHVIMRDGLRSLLNSQGDVEIVGEAAEGNQAQALLQEKKPDLMIVDLELPGENGIELTRRFKAQLPDCRFIVFTGQLDPKYAQEALAAGASGYLRKTNGAGELIHALETVLKGEIYLCTATTTAIVQSSQRLGQPPTGPGRLAIPARELEILQRVVKGLRNKEIAEELGINVKTVETYRSRLMKRVGCSSPAELVRFAFREGIAKL